MDFAPDGAVYRFFFSISLHALDVYVVYRVHVLLNVRFPLPTADFSAQCAPQSVAVDLCSKLTDETLEFLCWTRHVEV